MNQYFHQYTGIVVQNDDPEKMGRVKVFVPEVNMTLYKGWNDDRDTDKTFTTLGGNVGDTITPEILQRLKVALPWGRIKHPIFGMGTSITYHNDSDMAEQGGDSDSSDQQVVKNKVPEASKPENNKVTPSPLAKIATPPVNSSKALNEYSNPSTSSTDATAYIQNSTKTEETPTTTPSTTSTVAPTTTDDNISRIEITFNANDRNSKNLHRKFTTSAQTSVQDVTPTGFSPPITYTSASVASPSTGSLPIVFRPSSATGNSKPTPASDVSYDGKDITVKGKTPTVISKKDITAIGVVYNDPKKSTDLKSNRIGELKGLFAEYNTPPTGTSDPIMPPTTSSGASKFNKGGGGSEMFSNVGKSTILPVSVLVASQIGGIHPTSKQTINYGEKIDNGTDPNEQCGSNQQTSACGLPNQRSESQNNTAKGMISIPAVGAQVSVFFENGNPLFPIVDGIYYSQEDMMGIHAVS